MTKFIFILLTLLTFQFSFNPAPPETIEPIQATNTIEGVVNELLSVLSGEIGEERDWDAYRNLFLPNGQIIMIDSGSRPHNQARSMTPEEFIRYFGPYYKKEGFIEISTGISIQEFNGIANVFQSYQSKNLTGTYEQKGINAYQMVYHQERWWIASTTWSNVQPGGKIPDAFVSPEYRE